MNRYWKFAGIALLALAMFVPAASAQRFAFRGGFGPRGGFYGPRFYGPSFYYGYGPGWFGGPFWYGAGFYGAGWYEPYGYVPAPTAGKVKIDTKMKDAQVYVDGGYAGTVGQLGTFPLRDGTHDIGLRGPDGQSLHQDHIDVIAGKTVHIKL